MSHEDIRQTRDRWLSEAINLCPEIVRPEAEEYFRPLLKRCNAKSKKTFWQWLRLQMSKSEDAADFLEWMRESRCAFEVQQSRKAGFRYVVNGDVALIEVVDGKNTAVWRVPVEKTEWALSLYPVKLKPIPPVETQAERDVRFLTRKLARDGWRLTQEQKRRVIAELSEAEGRRLREPKPEPRFMLVKYDVGQEWFVHRLYLDVGTGDEVEAVDGDFLNFVTARIRVTVESVLDNGIGVRKGDRPLAETREFVVPNLRIVNSDTEQKKFEKAMLQQLDTPDGEPIETSPPVQPNATWLAGCYGEEVDAGKHKPLTKEEIALLGRGNVELPSDSLTDARGFA